MNRRLGIGAPLILLVVLVCGLSVALRATAESPAVSIGPLTVEVPAEVQAGAGLPLAVRADATDGAPVTLTLIGGYGPLVFHGEFQGGVARFPISAADTTIAGVVTVVVRAGTQTATGTFTVLPGAAVEPVKPLVGARTIVADGDHWSMTVAIPFDRWGNPVADGTDVTIDVLHANGATTSENRPVTHLVAWTRVVSGTVAGRTVISTRVGPAVGPEGVVDEVAGWPAPFDVHAMPATVAADGRSQVTLRTSEIRDAFGNVLPDGTLVTFVATSPEGERRIPAVTIGGFAEAPLRAPAAPMQIDVRAIVFDVESQSIAVEFSAGPAVGTFPVAPIVLDRAGVLSVQIGPVVGEMGQYVPDGTVLSISIENGDRDPIQLDTTVMSGHATVEIRLVDLTPGAREISVSAGSGSGSTMIDIPASTSATPVASPESDPRAA